MAITVFIFGGSGFTGQHTAKLLLENGYNVFIPTRRPRPVQYGKTIAFDRDHIGKLFHLRTSEYAIVNLAGESINSGRWTEKRRTQILNSRVELTRAIAKAVLSTPHPPVALVNASAIGYYGYSLTDEFTEASAPGKGFLPEVTRQWEGEALRCTPVTRVAVIRLGMVLGADGGALPKMVLPYRMYAGGRMGSGQQWISWIHVEDVAHGIKACLEDPQYSGSLNFVSPHPVTMDEFGKVLSRTLKRPHWLPVPPWALQIALGQMSEIVLQGQKVLPQKLEQYGFRFHYPTLPKALANLLH